MARGTGPSKPIIRHYPKDDQRRDLHNSGTGMDTGFAVHVPTDAEIEAAQRRVDARDARRRKSLP